MNFNVLAVLLSIGVMIGTQSMSVDEKTQLVKTAIEACGKEIGASKDDIAALMNKEQDLPESSKCILTCLMKKFNLVGADGKLSMDGLKKITETMHPNDDSLLKLAEEIGTKCMAAAGPYDSDCETTYKYSKCFHEEMQSRGLVPT